MIRKLLALALFGTIGCNGLVSGIDADAGVEESGAVHVLISSVPLNVGCVVITDASSRVVTQSFSVMPGKSASLLMGNLPVGGSNFDAVAYPGSCPPAASTQATWSTAASTRVTIAAGIVSSLQLYLAPVGGANIGINFVDGGTSD